MKKSSPLLALLPFVLAFLAASSFAPRHAQAAPLLFTLTGVVFADGATATGSFVFDPSTSTFSTFDITTGQGVVGDAYSGSHYLPATAATSSLSSPDAFIFDGFSFDQHYLDLSVSTHITSPGVYALAAGSSGGAGSFNNSGEFVDGSFDYRLITGGSLTVTNAPEPATIALLGIGLAGLIGIARRRTRA